MMRLFSSRRAFITADLRAGAARFEQRYGRAPSQRELAHLAQASNFKTRAAKHGKLDLAQLHAGWADKLTRTLGVSLASVAPSVWHEGGRATTRGATPPGPALTEAELARAAQKALALAQQDKSAWTRADVIKHLGRVLPRTGMNPAAAAAMLEDLADRALASEFEPVLCLEAPELAEVPPSLRRADGRSIYQRHGGTRYATRAQLAMEQRMLTQARASTAPRLARDQAAHALGANLEQLENALTGATPRTREQPAQTGLREDQATAALAALTDGGLVSVINAPAGSGKTRVLAEAARIWAEACLARSSGSPRRSPPATPWPPASRAHTTPPSSSATCPAAAARGPIPIGPGTLLVVDEASMLTGPDLADLIDYARTRGAKIILAGDLSQLQAVENGGGMSLLATRLGYARLADPVRFRHPWEQHASLRLRDGDTTVLADYDQHGRIHAGDPEQTMDAAAAAYVALSTSGTDTVLMAADHALRRELNRRIRDDLITLGLVQARPAVTIADGAEASPGDLIICTRNDHTTEAGEPGRTLANGDLLRIEAITRDGLIVRRALDADPRPGQRRWTDRHFPFNFYQDAELGYAVTDHAAQSRTVHTGLAVITGTEDPPARLRRPDPRHRRQPRLRLHRIPETRRLGPRPAPELARYDTISAERADDPAPATPPATADTALGVLAAVLERTASSAPPPRPAARPWPTPTTWPCCTPSGPPRPARPASSATGTCSRPSCRPAITPARAPGPVAVADPARRRTRRPGPRPGPRRRGRRTRPRRRPRHPGRPRYPHPEPDRLPGPAPARAVVRTRPRHRRPRTPRLRHRDRRAHGRPQATPRRARRRMRAAVGGQRARPGAGASGLPAGLAAPGRRHRGVAGAIRLPQPNRPDRTRTRRGRPGPAGRLARGPGRPRPGRRPGRTRHAGTACCCTCATPTPSRPPGRPGTSRTSSARSATPPGTPA